MVAMRFDYRDIFQSMRLAFGFQRLWIQFYGFFRGYLVYLVLTYLSLILAGKDFGTLWARYGLLPSPGGTFMPWYSWIVFGIGALLLLFSWLLAGTGVARATYMHLKGNTFYTWKEACRFALKKKSGSIISTPLAIALIAVFIAVGGVVVGLLGRIPYAGELGISLFSSVWFLAALFLVFVILALAVSLILVPAILATTDDDAFEGIFQSFSTLYSQPLRFIVYEIYLIVISVVGFVVLAFFAKQAWGLMTTILVWGMGDKYADLSYAASYNLQNWVYPAVAWSRAYLGEFSAYIFFAREFTALELPLMMNISTWIFSIVLVLTGGLILSYPLAIFNAGNTLIFLILKKKKDDENLLERKDREEEEEEEEKPEEEKPVEKPERVKAENRPGRSSGKEKPKTARKTAPRKRK